jgi:hypothetical protein
MATPHWPAERVLSRNVHESDLQSAAASWQALQARRCMCPFYLQNAGTGGTVDQVEKEVAEKFAAFEDERDPALLHEALDAIEVAERDIPSEDTAARKQALSRWLAFVSALDRNIDPNWNPKNVPVTGATPPESHGIVYPSGEVDPSTIPDPAARARYEQALKASKDYAVDYGIQMQLHGIDERAMRLIGRLVAERYNNSAEDRKQLEALFAAPSINARRKERLEILLPGAG